MSARTGRRRRKQLKMNNKHLAKIGRPMYPTGPGQNSTKAKRREEMWRANKAKGLF